MTAQNQTSPTIIRRKQVEARVGLARSSLYDKIQKGEFPKPINLGGRSVGWLESDVDAWIQSRIAASRV